MTLLLTNDDVERALTMRDCIDVLERAYPELGEGVGVSRTVSQIFTPTDHSKEALYSFKSMDGVAPFAGIAAIRLTSEILTWPKDASGRAKKVRIPTSSAIVKGIAESTITWERDPDYGYLVASDVPGVDDVELLQPKRLYERTGQLDEYWKLLGLLKHNRVAFLEQFPSLSAEIVYAVS